MVGLFAGNYKKVYINDTILTYLQCPTSKESSEKCIPKNFKNDNNRHFTFSMCGEHNRSELRFADEFDFSDGTFRELDASVKIREFNDKRASTYIQIHTKGGINKPILRVATFNRRLKLFIYNGDRYIKKTLMTWDNDKEILGKELKFRVIVKDKDLIVYFNGRKVIKVKINVDDLNYYKIGDYLQRDGCSKDEVYKITYINWEFFLSFFKN